MHPLKILVTGGAGFIGSALVRHLLVTTDHLVLNVDNLSYSGDLRSLTAAEQSERYRFLHADIRDEAAIDKALSDFRPDVITHLAAHSHVDRSIEDPGVFIDTNVVGTFTLLSSALKYWRGLRPDARDLFRFHHISTDEVFGSLGEWGYFTEATAYDPRSPYSASKAASDHLVRAWGHTYGLPVIVTNCSNNYGPYQFPEKLIPLMILKGLRGEPLPVYGQGNNVRDWLHVDDHARALVRVFERGRSGETYIIGGKSERTNLQVVKSICQALDQLRPRGDGSSHYELLTFVTDRPGHDQRYAVDPSKIERELGWRPQEGFDAGIEATVRWYVENETWWRPIADRADTGQRLGLVR